MPKNDYRCPVHGVMEIFFSGNPPRKCPECDSEITFVIAHNQFTLGGDMTVLDEPTRRGVSMQLGGRVETRDDLRRLEKKKGVERIDRHEFQRGTDGPRWKPARQFSQDDIRDAVNEAKRDGRFPESYRP